ncbi:HAMP domain-containing sensor histidine kinase [Clostridium uliginosum]|uniref:histidine kinase n=1 Tax=Clostridium uliginosum TaxID=119641 RepID=A0A1I1KVC6_9CLOT|nr:ATP-binding protein [Clostridium uliginosum]SFC64222.1 PAS domain S-box-containing protein [Clostridium uliginosum]
MIKSMKFKISLILIVFILLTIGNSVVSISYFNKLERSIDLIMDANYDSVVAAQNMNDALERQDSLELSFIFEDNEFLSSEHESNHMKFLEWIYKAKNNITEDGEKEILEVIEKNYTDYSNKIKDLESVKAKEGNEKVNRYYYNNIFPLFQTLKEECNELLNINQQSMLNMRGKSKELANSARYCTVIISALVLIIGLSIIGYLLKKIIHPIEDLAVGINKISAGNYEYKIPLKREKEINYILNDFNDMAEKLKQYEKLNINEILREKQKAEGIIESIDFPIIVTNDDNKVIMLNKSAERLFDVKEKNTLNRHFLECIEQREVFNIIQKARNSVKEYKGFNDIEIDQNDNKVYFRISANPIWFENNENIATVTIMQDITKFKEIDNMKSDFISNVSHEFRTPLTSICMAVGLLLEENNEGRESQTELLTIIKEDSERLDNLVSELLDLSKMEAGKIEMDIKDVDIKDVINQVKRTFKIQLQEKNITLNINTKTITRKARVDINKISWVVVNLVGNALRYTKIDGTGVIEIKAKEVNNTMLISITDNGEGIPEQDQKIIFEKFIQLKDSSGQITGNSGLGLAICKEIIKAHLGDIWVDSKLGEGSTFYFTLKLGGVLDEEENTNS